MFVGLKSDFQGATSSHAAELAIGLSFKTACDWITNYGNNFET
jgi:hypothetical protein